MTTLREILKALPEHTIIKDGATDWDAECLIDAIKDGDRPEQLDDSYLLDGATGHICRVGEDGYLITPGEFKVTTTTARFIETDHDGNENERRDWYEIEGEEFALVHNTDGTTTVIDADGKPIPSGYDSEIRRAIEAAGQPPMADAYNFVLARSDHGDGGWSLHAPGATDERIANGDEPALVSGAAEWDDENDDWSRPNAADYKLARWAHDRVKIEGGEGEDRDTGWIVRVVDDMAFVNWDSGVATYCPVDLISEVA